MCESVCVCGSGGGWNGIVCEVVVDRVAERKMAAKMLDDAQRKLAPSPEDDDAAVDVATCAGVSLLHRGSSAGHVVTPQKSGAGTSMAGTDSSPPGHKGGAKPPPLGLLHRQIAARPAHLWFGTGALDGAG